MARSLFASAARRLGGLTLSIAAGAGCRQTHVPQPAPDAPNEAYLRAPRDAVWQGVIAFFADSRMPIATIDKESGLIASRAFALSSDQRLAWMHCGSAGGASVVEPADSAVRAEADFNVLVRPAGASTAVRVNVGFNASRVNPVRGDRYAPLECMSNGTFERALLNAIRFRTEAAR
jgi:hypothetical protein